MTLPALSLSLELERKEIFDLKDAYMMKQSPLLSCLFLVGQKAANTTTLKVLTT